jgi:DNA-binding CsgD family transcriptional regulator
MYSDTPMVGRQEERDLVLDVIEQGTARGVVIAGAAGVGKTRLARAVVGELADAGFAVEWVVGTRAASTIPFGAVAPLLPTPRVPSSGRQPIVDTMSEIRHAVAARSAGRGLVLGVDDAHCLDDASAALLLQLGVTTAASLVMTVRSDEPAPDAVTALWKDGLTERLELQPLSDHEMGELIATVLDGPVEAPTLAELVHHSGGNCLFLHEMIRAARGDGTLVQQDGRWRLRGPRPTSGRLIELVEARARDLPPATRDVVELVAVGEPYPLRVLEAMVPPEALEDAARRGLVDIELERRRAHVRLSHPIYSEVLRSTLSSVSQRSRCRALATAMEATGLRRSDDVVRVVAWQLDAGLTADPDRLRAACRRALEGNDLSAAVRFATAAVDAVEAQGPDGEGGRSWTDARAEARYTLADSLLRQSRMTEAMAVLGPLAGEMSEVRAVEYAESQAHLLFLGLATPEAAYAHLMRVGSSLSPWGRARLDLCRARLLMGNGRVTDALRLVDEATRLVPPGEVEPWALSVQALALVLSGRYSEALIAVERGLDPALDKVTEVSTSVSWSSSTLCLVAVGRGDWDTAEAMARGLLDHGLALRNWSVRRAGAALTGWYVLQRGQVGPAIELCLEGTTDRGGLETNGLRTLAFAGLATAYALAGDPDRADAVLARAAADVRPPINWFDGALELARAHAAARRGLTADAEAILDAALVSADRAGLRFIGLFLAIAANRIGVHELAARWLRRNASDIEGPLPGLALDHAEALRAGDPELLDAVAKRWEEVGQLLVAAECLTVSASGLMAAGRGREGSAVQARARRLLEQCPGAAAPMGGYDEASALTPRELEIARLARSGLSSAAIAERLVISVRTVDTHLGRVYVKLGVRSRAELRHAPEVQVPGLSRQL